MTMRGKLGIQQFSVDAHLKTTALRWHKSDRFDHVLIILEQFFCQTHGPTQVVSDRAINDLDFQHDPSANFERLYHWRMPWFLKKRGNRLSELGHNSVKFVLEDMANIKLSAIQIS